MLRRLGFGVSSDELNPDLRIFLDDDFFQLVQDGVVVRSEFSSYDRRKRFEIFRTLRQGGSSDPVGRRVHELSNEFVILEHRRWNPADADLVRFIVVLLIG